MKLRRYCVTVNDNWTPMRLFWTLGWAKKFYRQHKQYANVFHWNGVGLLSAELEGQLREHIVDTCNAFGVPTIAERPVAQVGDHDPEHVHGSAA